MSAKTDQHQQQKVSNEELKKLVVERLKTFPSDKGISIGSAGTFTRDDLVQRVQQGDSIGQQIMEIELEFLRAMKSIAKGELTDESLPSDNKA